MDGLIRQLHLNVGVDKVIELLDEVINEPISSLKEIVHLDEGEAMSVADSYVLILQDGRSVVFTSWTDWTLRVLKGNWPELPTWCWPPESWKYGNSLAGIGTDGFARVESYEIIFNEVKEAKGVNLLLEKGAIRLRSGNLVTLDILFD
jgi:hypothetical protein